ncbi:MAG: preprotein translocase subunit SecA [Clostridia bacterium]|nr:preprotein translocase subunit SecA [Clostridia bacterium]
MGLLTKIFGTHSDREIKKIMPVVDKILALEPSMQALSDSELSAQTEKFKERYKNGESLDSLLPEAFATVREASFRVLSKKPFPVQLIGGIVLHEGRIAEMKTGEGKTLTATLPAYLNALTGEGVHIVTVNEYLASTQAEEMGKLFNFLGLSVGTTLSGRSPEEKRAAYACDITYGTNNEFGFDYLRDNMVIYKENMVQRPHTFAVVDEVDSILIDEARTPLIISGRGEESSILYTHADRFAKTLKAFYIKETDDKENNDNIDADYIVEERSRSVTLTAKGIKKAEMAFNIENLSDPENMTLSHHINQAVRANSIMKRDVDYVVKDGEIIIVDEFTGRLMYGRRYNEGLHQAIEAKEGVKVANESRTLATITFQNYFRLYKKLSGMTGTAITEEEEFREIYKLDVVAIPTNRPMIRIDHDDRVYKNERGKFMAIAAQVEECYKKGQPILVGTISIEKSEALSALLKKKGIPHQVLNAKHHEKEAHIVAQAGRKGAVTISTNMAGRGTDILLGGNPEIMALDRMRKEGYEESIVTEANIHTPTVDPEILSAREYFKKLYDEFKIETDKEHEEVVKAGGLFILGTERHESRRIDNQLRGRSGRQGDPGESRFLIALDDDLMRRFGSDRIEAIMSMTGFSDDEPIEARILSGVIENAQKRVESNHFAVRRNVLRYDDVINQQRTVMYNQRAMVLDNKDLKQNIITMAEKVFSEILSVYASDNYADNWEWEGLNAAVAKIIPMEAPLSYDKSEYERLSKEWVLEDLMKLFHENYEKQEEIFGDEMREVERVIMLQVVDRHWMQHIDDLAQLREGISLRAYAQHDPVVEYQSVSSDMFDEMNSSIREETVRGIMHVRKRSDATERKQVAKAVSTGESKEVVKKPVVNEEKKIGRNDPCPCGSGKKYKQCCGNK